MTAEPRIYVDLSSAQDPHYSERGIAAYARNLSAAIERIEPGAVAAWTLAPETPDPIGLEALTLSGRVIVRDPRTVTDAALWHIVSPFDTAHDPLRIVHPLNRPLVVTLYDLIPLIFDDEYLQQPSARARYFAHLELIRRADHVLCISQSTADDAIALLGLDPASVSVAGIAIDPLFSASRSRADAWAHVRAAVPGLRAGFVMYTGGSDARKNIAGLIAAYAGLPAELRAEHQLCIVCRLDDSTLRHYSVMADQLGVADDVLLTGFVESDILAALYRSADLFVFPSLYEGYGLPVAEALASGTPAVVADNSSLVEIVPFEEGRFDADDPEEIRAAIVRGLTDIPLRERLIALADSVPTEWDAVARATLRGYRLALADAGSPERQERHEPSVAVVCVAGLLTDDERRRAQDLLEEYAGAARVDVFGENGDPRLRRASSFDSHLSFLVAEAVRGRYHDIVFLRGERRQQAADALLARIGRGRIVDLTA